MILELDHINKVYHTGKLDVPVLHDVCLHVEKGEYVAIMGPSGSGKSTLMNIIGCLDRPDSGTYVLNGLNVLDKDDRTMANIRLNHLGFVFQNFQLLSKSTALENVALPLVYAKVPKKERKERARAALERVGLGDRVTFLPGQLSGGQKQRVAIARAMVNRPGILLADEPTGALDSHSSLQIMELFQELNEEGVTVLMITHSPDIAAYARRVCDIFDGVISERNGEVNAAQLAERKAEQEAEAALARMRRNSAAMLRHGSQERETSDISGTPARSVTDEDSLSQGRKGESHES